MGAKYNVTLWIIKYVLLEILGMFNLYKSLFKISQALLGNSA